MAAGQVRMKIDRLHRLPGGTSHLKVEEKQEKK
jgi:hypothetical protein